MIVHWNNLPRTRVKETWTHHSNFTRPLSNFPLDVVKLEAELLTGHGGPHRPLSSWGLSVHSAGLSLQQHGVTRRLNTHVET